MIFLLMHLECYRFASCLERWLLVFDFVNVIIVILSQSSPVSFEMLHQDKTCLRNLDNVFPSLSLFKLKRTSYVIREGVPGVSNDVFQLQPCSCLFCILCCSRHDLEKSSELCDSLFNLYLEVLLLVLLFKTRFLRLDLVIVLVKGLLGF